MDLIVDLMLDLSLDREIIDLSAGLASVEWELAGLDSIIPGIDPADEARIGNLETTARRLRDEADRALVRLAGLRRGF